MKSQGSRNLPDLLDSVSHREAEIGTPPNNAQELIRSVTNTVYLVRELVVDPFNSFTSVISF